MGVVHFDDLKGRRRRRIADNVIRAAQLRGTQAQQDMLHDPTVLHNVCAEAWLTYHSKADANAIGDGAIMDQILRFLQFMLDNWDIIGPIFGKQTN